MEVTTHERVPGDLVLKVRQRFNLQMDEYNLRWYLDKMPYPLPAPPFFQRCTGTFRSPCTCIPPCLLRFTKGKLHVYLSPSPTSGNILGISYEWGFTTIIKFFGHSLTSGNRYLSSRGPAAILYHNHNNTSTNKIYRSANRTVLQ
jgi:hypothetical protein